MNITKLMTFIGGILFIIILYLIIYYSLKIMYKDVKTGGKTKGNNSDRVYGLEVIEVGVNSTLEQGSVIPIRGNVTLGRKQDNIIIFTEPFVSGNHGKIYVKDNSLYIEDLNSTNGIYVNDQKIEEQFKLMADDEIKIGSAVFKVLRSGK